MSDALVNRPSLSLQGAERIAAAALKYAREKNWPVVVAIVDASGHLLYLARMDGAQLGSVQVAQDKAYSALAFKRPTKVFSEALVGGRLSVLGIQGATPVEGGLPLVVAGVCVGAIGISGVTSEQDGEIALAAAQALLA